MTSPNFILLYCTRPEVSADFYATLLQRAPVEQSPTDLDFGYTAVTADPDGHRLRVFVPQA